jgi:tRNA-2-methylthio-N6-dimethylallyladenosine synthase
VLRETSLEYNQTLVGRTVTVLVEKADRKPGYLQGRTEGKISVRFASADESLIGTFAEVRIGSAVPFSLEGTLVS